MKQIVKGAVIGAICGVAAPVGLAVANEVLFAHNKYNDVTAARICFAERTWSLFRLDIKYAKGCKNGLLDSVPLCLVVGVLGGSLLGALSLVSKNTEQRTTDQPAPPAVVPQEPLAASATEQTPDPVERSFKDAPKPSLPSIAPQVSQGLEQLKEINWVKAGAGAAVAAVVVIFGISTLGGNKNEKQESGILDGLISTRKKGQQQIMVLQSVGKSFGANNPDFEIPVSDRFSICKSKNNAISNDELNQKLANGASIVSQGTQITISVKYTTFSSVPCNLITYIIEE